MKKALCIIFALMLCMSVVFTGCGDEQNTGGSVEDNSDFEAFLADDSVGDVRSDNEIMEGETTVETHIPAEVEIFVNNTYYIEGTIYSSGAAMGIKLATDKDNVQLTAAVSGIEICMLVLDNKTYVVQPSAKLYTELSDNLLSVLGLEDSFSVSDFQSITDELGENPEFNIKQSIVTINGEPGLCNEYVYDEATIKLYSIGEKLIQIDNYDSTGTLTMQIVVDEISSIIPSDQLTLKGLEQASVSNFVASFFSTAG